MGCESEFQGVVLSVKNDRNSFHDRDLNKAYSAGVCFELKHECAFMKHATSDEGLTLETSALKLFTVANLRYQLS